MPLAFGIGPVDVKKMQGRMPSMLFQEPAGIVPVTREISRKAPALLQL